jgi:hypothetical protein
MGRSHSRDQTLLLPQQEVISLSSGAAGSHLRSGQAAQIAAANAAAALARHCETQKVKIQFFWDKTSFCLKKGPEKYLWELHGSFTTEIPCHVSVHFHCKETEQVSKCTLARWLTYPTVDEAAPPTFETYHEEEGKHTVSLSGNRAIDLRRWPLEVFWRYKKKRANVLPIVFVLAANGVQSILQFSLEVPRTDESQGPSAAVPTSSAQTAAPETRARNRLPTVQAFDLKCNLLREKVVVRGLEYTLQEIYGLADLEKEDRHDEAWHGEPCVICLSEPRNTAVLPCRHLCCCEECARILSVGSQLRAETCPVCRGKITGLQVFEVKSVIDVGAK